jgi:hypothetical protein
MDELEISGRRFLSTRRAAKEHKYTADYVGQLIRSGKVKGQKVGRSWYVDEQSLNSYLSGETAVAEPVAKAEVKEQPVERLVEEPAEVEEVVEKPVEQLVEKKPAAKVSVATVVEERVVEEVPTSRQKIESRNPDQSVEEKVFEPVIIKTKPAEEHHIPIRTVVQVPEKPMGGLRYVADDEPALPEVQRKSAVTSIPVKPLRRAPVAEVEEEQVEEYRENVSDKKFRAFAFAMVVVAGLVTLSASAVISATLNSKIVVEEGQTANVGYSFR